MKRLFIYLLTCIFSAQLALQAMDWEYEYIPRPESETSLTNLCTKAITKKIDTLIKKAAKATAADEDLKIGNVMAYAQDIMSGSSVDAQETIRKTILSQCVRKSFKHYEGEGYIRMAQHYDGTTTAERDRKNNPLESRLIQSPWYALPLEELVKNYAMVYNAQKKHLPHPFCTIEHMTTPGPLSPLTPGPMTAPTPEPLELFQNIH